MRTTGVFRRITLAVAFAGLASAGASAQTQDPTPQQDIRQDKERYS